MGVAGFCACVKHDKTCLSGHYLYNINIFLIYKKIYILCVFITVPHSCRSSWRYRSVRAHVFPIRDIYLHNFIQLFVIGSCSPVTCNLGYTEAYSSLKVVLLMVCLFSFFYIILNGRNNKNNFRLVSQNIFLMSLDEKKTGHIQPGEETALGENEEKPSDTCEEVIRGMEPGSLQHTF